jgi:hypothetical protein
VLDGVTSTIDAVCAGSQRHAVNAAETDHGHGRTRLGEPCSSIPSLPPTVPIQLCALLRNLSRMRAVSFGNRSMKK